MGLISHFFRKRAIREYLRRLPVLFSQEYGMSEALSWEQIQSTIQRHNLNPRYVVWAIAIFASPEAYDSFRRSNPDVPDYVSIRSRIAHEFFGDDLNFSARFRGKTYRQSTTTEPNRDAFYGPH